MDNQGLVLSGVHVFDGFRLLDQAHDVVVGSGRIVDITEHASRISRHYGEGDYRVVPLNGYWVTPGLIDTHVHSTRESDMRAYIKNGVTSIRYAGTATGVVESLRRRIAAEGIDAPRIFSCGPMIDGDPPSYPELSVVVRSPDEARRTAARLLDDRQSDSLLIVQRIDIALAGPIADVAHERDVPIFGQTWRLSGEEAAAVGVSQLDNTSRVFVSPRLSETDITSPLSLNERIDALREGWAHLDWERTRTSAQIMAEAGVRFCPTIVRLQWSAALPPCTEDALRADDDAELFDEAEISEWMANLHRYGQLSAERKAEWRSALDNFREWVAYFQSVGGHVVAGTDTQFGGLMIHRELENLVACGMDQQTALAAATGRAGEALGRRAHVGVVRSGAHADLLVFDENPVRNLRTLRSPKAVVIEGSFVLDDLEQEDDHWERNRS